MNNIKAHAAFDAVLRSDFYSFLMKVFETLHPGQPPLSDAWYLRAICYNLRRVWRGEDRRLVILVPPRHLKSITVSVAYSAWILGKDPTQKSWSPPMARIFRESTQRTRAL